MIPYRMNPMGVASLPYKRKLEYLESTGTQWIDTGVIPFAGMPFEVKFSYSGASSSIRYVFGLFEYNNPTSSFWFGFNNAGKIGFNNGAQNLSLSNGVSGSPNTIYTAVCDENGFAVNGNIASTSTVSGYTYEHSIPLFIRHNYGSPPEFELPGTGVRIYSITLGSMELIPVIDKQNVPCMFNKVSGTMLYNSGSGQFLYA